ncbi:hypothetical protein [Paraflavitalea pollutisoli]|uniref:hypothetical protein n=1 Tax=Paraflavitalea pollutisoli TaxID=3034143 RepID=UPI0023EBDC93|nr:hypothetical protein [Paraflavitalea sp. H1-2-19X]
MKKYLILLLTAVIVSSAWAQDDELIIHGTTKVSKNLAPKVVIDSLNKTFPNAKAVQYYKTPKSVAQSGWTVTEQNDLGPTDDVDYYTISFTRNNMKYYGLYRANGELVSSRLRQNVTQLPRAISTSLKSLGTQHPGYSVVSKTYYKNTNHSKKKEYYEVVATNGKNKKTLFYAPDGTIVKVKG